LNRLEWISCNCRSNVHFLLEAFILNLSLAHNEAA
jgi:hypothetical protein